MARGGGSTVEVKKPAFDSFNHWVQARLGGSVYKNARNYYTTQSGRVVTQWPFSTLRFWWLTRTARRSAICESNER